MSEPQFMRIPTHRIRPNPNQPRRVITPIAIELMEASLREMGQQTPAKVHPLTEAERKDDPEHDYELIGGHIRHAGALKAGLATLDCLVYDYTPEQAELAGLMDNQSTEMHWLDWVIAIERLYTAQTEKSQRKLAAQLGITGARVNQALKVANALNSASRELTVKRLNTLGPESAGSENPVRALADLDDPQLVEKALPVLYDLQLSELQAKSLVTWIQTGNPPETFNHKPTPKAKSAPKVKIVEASLHTSVSAEADASPSTHPAAPHTAKPTAPLDPSVTSAGETMFWEWVAGIPIISKIKSKLKKGETLSGGEKLLVLTWRFLKNLGWMIKHGFKAVRHTIKFIWKVFIDALKTLGLYKFAHAAVVLVLFAGILWFGWDIHQHGLFHPIRVITAKFSPKETVVPTQISIPKPTAPVVASVPTLQPTPTVTKPKTDVADNLLKQAAPDVAGDVAKKLFGI